ncbi:hypothetical protein [Lacticaseibacillus rhamnosus]|uniref:hypothetical protein n=1 Tax=Lacticaseibacillus rhamnosus TaxID=47715 RepID=UPI002012DA2C|nr:hypothetical protein [Lacticaseibacillus rhamnosus]
MIEYLLIGGAFAVIIGHCLGHSEIGGSGLNEEAIAKLVPLISYLYTQAENARLVGHNYRQGTDQDASLCHGTRRRLANRHQLNQRNNWQNKNR